MVEGPVGVAIIGCGLIGQKRARALGSARLVACADLIYERAETLALSVAGASPFENWESIINDSNVDVVIVATHNSDLAPITAAAVEAGKHVLVEKPGARNTSELDIVIEAVNKANVQVRVGFNHRYHPALQKAYELYQSGALGDLMFLRGRYGHGGRLGYENEWRADPALSGGGELIDQGVHMIDLSRWFLGDFNQVEGFAHTYFWPMPVEDNGFMILRTPEEQTAFLHVSCTEWKNMFSLEIYGRDAKLQIDGLGGSYGLEKLTFYRMLPEMGPPDTTIWEYPHADDSWEREMKEFLEDIRMGREPSANLFDARAALKIVEEIYSGSGYDYHA